MIDLSLINDLCEKKGISKKKMCDDLGFAPSKVTDMLKNNSTTLVNLEKIAQYFGVSVGLFFGESNLSQKDSKKLNNTLTILQNTNAIFKKRLRHFFDGFMDRVKEFYDGVYVEDEKETGKIIKSKVKTTKKLTTQTEFEAHIANDLIATRSPQDYEYEELYGIFVRFWKLPVKDIRYLYLSGIINKETFTVFSLYARTGYDVYEFYELYKQYRTIKEIDDIEDEWEEMLDELDTELDKAFKKKSE